MNLFPRKLKEGLMSFDIKDISAKKSYFILLGFVRALNMLAWYDHLIPKERFILGRYYSENERLNKLNLLPS